MTAGEPTSTPADGLRLLIDQMRRASEAGLYLVALMTALTLPDILGALGSDNGRASGAKYRRWIEDHGGTRAMGASSLYSFRCSLLHQGSSQTEAGSHIAFMEPGERLDLHALSTVAGAEEIAWLSIPMFVEEIAAAAEAWLDQFGETTLVKRNLTRFAHRRPEGLPPHVIDMAVIA